MILESPSFSCGEYVNPTEIGKRYGLSAQKVNNILAGAGYQHKIADKWEAIGEGEKLSVMQDTGKKHSDGTPVCQLKWYSTILPVFEELLESEEE